MSLTANTIFAVLMALEADLRQACREALPDAADPLSSDESSLAGARLRADTQSDAEGAEWRQLIEYVDLSQLLDIMGRHKKAIGGHAGLSQEELVRVLRDVRRLVPTRNRVCHARPPEPDDLASVMEVAEPLARGALGLSFVSLTDVLHELNRNQLYPLT